MLRSENISSAHTPSQGCFFFCSFNFEFIDQIFFWNLVRNKCIRSQIMDPAITRRGSCPACGMRGAQSALLPDHWYHSVGGYVIFGPHRSK